MTPLADSLSIIQGNIFGGFNKDYQDFIILKFNNAKDGRAWIKEISDPDNDLGVSRSSSTKVIDFNAQFKALKAAGLKPEQFISVEWTNLAISFHGLQALGLNAKDLGTFPPEFQGGMAARNKLIGDVGTSDPSKWIAPFNKPADLHAILLVAADSEKSLADRVATITAATAFKAGVTQLGSVIEGRTRADEPGHEHFGFKDGVSQPGVRGVTLPDDPVGNPNQGQPGQDLLWPGEFVLGHPTQKEKPRLGVDGPNPDPGSSSKSGPPWTENGSYLVFRRLAQNVPGFTQQVATLAAAAGIHPDLMGAKLVGRYKSGCPIETRTFQAPSANKKPPQQDPGKVQPALADNDTLNNNFEFGDDKDGAICPLASHIRKAYPRDEQTTPDPDASESETQTHRLLRRGIPFGASLGVQGRVPGGGVAEGWSSAVAG